MERMKLDPASLTPSVGRVVIQEDTGPTKVGSIHLPVEHGGRILSGLIVKINPHDNSDAEDLVKGQRVWVSPHVAEDDSMFFEHEDKNFMLVPCEAIQMVETV